MNQVAKIERSQELVQPLESATLLSVISRAASDPNADIEKMERLMAMYERMESKRAETSFNNALGKAQAEIGRIGADKTNSQTKSAYASYAALDREVRPVYTRHGFALSFDTGDAPENKVRVICHASHEDGHTRIYHVDMPADGKGAKGGDVMTKTHAAGSAMTYGQRYLLKLIFNVAIGVDPEDDDGNGAEGDPAADWYSKIEATTCVADLKDIADEIKTAGLNARALRNVRAAYAKRQKELA